MKTLFNQVIVPRFMMIVPLGYHFVHYKMFTYGVSRNRKANQRYSYADLFRGGNISIPFPRGRVIRLIRNIIIYSAAIPVFFYEVQHFFATLQYHIIIINKKNKCNIVVSCINRTHILYHFK